jgi:hypothetical protein
VPTNVRPQRAGPRMQYACRKTLADSRPRVKGRFARNGEADADADEREASDHSYEYGRSHDELGNGIAYSTTGSCYDGDNGEWWWRAPGASAAGDDDAQRQRQVRFDDDDDDDDELWATLGDMMSMHLVS